MASWFTLEQPGFELQRSIELSRSTEKKKKSEYTSKWTGTMQIRVV